MMETTSKGNPDLTSNVIFSSKEKTNLKYGDYCAKLRLPNFNFQKTKGGEFLQTKLKNELVKDSVYELSLYLKLSVNSGYSVNHFGALFSVCALDVYDSLFYKGHLYESNLFFTKEFINTSKDWVKFKILYKAKGNEKYLVIGCFDKKDNRSYLKRINKTNSQVEKHPIIYVDNIILISH